MRVFALFSEPEAEQSQTKTRRSAVHSGTKKAGAAGGGAGAPAAAAAGGQYMCMYTPCLVASARGHKCDRCERYFHQPCAARYLQADYEYSSVCSFCQGTKSP